jgi:hypothetical protein
VKAGVRQIKAIRAGKAAQKMYGTIENATSVEIEDAARLMNSDIQEDVLAKNPDGCIDYYYERNPNNIEGIEFKDGFLYDDVDNPGKQLDGLTVPRGSSVNNGSYDVLISKSGASSWRQLYLTSRHEALHAKFYTYHPSWSINKHHRVIWRTFEKPTMKMFISQGVYDFH